MKSKSKESYKVFYRLVALKTIVECDAKVAELTAKVAHLTEVLEKATNYRGLWGTAYCGGCENYINFEFESEEYGTIHCYNVGQCHTPEACRSCPEERYYNDFTQCCDCMSLVCKNEETCVVKLHCCSEEYPTYMCNPCYYQNGTEPIACQLCARESF